MYVVAGVTGHTGKVVADTLLARGQAVRVIVRDAQKGEPWAARGAEVAIADLGDATALTAALRGATGAYVLVPPSFVAPDFKAYQRATSDAIATAVAAARVPHVVLLSSVGAELPDGTGPIAGLHYTEAKLGAIPGTVATFIRAGYFVENIGSSLGGLAHGVLPTFFPADLPVEMIATRDIGVLGATLLIEGARETSAVQLGSATTMNDVADALGRVTGTRPAVAVSPVEGMAAALEGYGVPGQIAALYQEMTAAIMAGRIHYHADLRHVARTTALDDVMRALLPA